MRSREVVCAWRRWPLAGGEAHPTGPAHADRHLEAAVLSHHYREMVTLLFPSPPPSVQRLLFPLIARIAQRRGHRAGEFAALA